MNDTAIIKEVHEDALRKQDFLKRLDILDSGCWQWNRKCKPNGYGNCGSGFLHQHAHRCAYLMFKDEIPSGLWVLHTCDNKKCCNPDHLYLGTVNDNVRDAIERGFWPPGKNKKKGSPGEKNSKAKLNEQDVISIRSSTLNASLLAKKYSVHVSQIQRILRGVSWTHV